jgi:hypothetical protein
MATLTVTLREAGAERALRMPLPEDKDARANALVAFAAQHVAAPNERGCLFSIEVPNARQLSEKKALGVSSPVRRTRAHKGAKHVTLTRIPLNLVALLRAPDDVEQGCVSAAAEAQDLRVCVCCVPDAGLLRTAGCVRSPSLARFNFFRLQPSSTLKMTVTPLQQSRSVANAEVEYSLHACALRARNARRRHRRRGRCAVLDRAYPLQDVHRQDAHTRSKLKHVH